MKREAIFDETGTYRYSLSRVWDEGNGRKVTFVLLHPGTADEYKEDATTNKCILLAKRWGFGSLEIVTLFAYQANRYNLLNELTKEEAVGYDNDRYIQYALADADLVIAAWGENSAIHGRNEDVSYLLEGREIFCLGTTHERHPRHPLFVPYNVILERFHIKPVSLIDYDELDLTEIIETSTFDSYLTDIIETNTFDPYDTIEPVQRVREIRTLTPPEEEDCWLFCTMCYDDYPMHGEAVCHTCHEKREKLYDYMI